MKIFRTYVIPVRHVGDGSCDIDIEKILSGDLDRDLNIIPSAFFPDMEHFDRQLPDALVKPGDQLRLFQNFSEIVRLERLPVRFDPARSGLGADRIPFKIKDRLQEQLDLFRTDRFLKAAYDLLLFQHFREHFLRKKCNAPLTAVLNGPDRQIRAVAHGRYRDRAVCYFIHAHVNVQAEDAAFKSVLNIPDHPGHASLVELIFVHADCKMVTLQPSADCPLPASRAERGRDIKKDFIALLFPEQAVQELEMPYIDDKDEPWFHRMIRKLAADRHVKALPVVKSCQEIVCDRMICIDFLFRGLRAPFITDSCSGILPVSHQKLKDKVQDLPAVQPHSDRDRLDCDKFTLVRFLLDKALAALPGAIAAAVAASLLLPPYGKTTVSIRDLPVPYEQDLPALSRIDQSKR